MVIFTQDVSIMLGQTSTARSSHQDKQKYSYTQHMSGNFMFEWPWVRQHSPHSEHSSPPDSPASQQLQQDRQP